MVKLHGDEKVKNNQARFSCSSAVQDVMGWDEPTFKGVWFRGEWDGLVPGQEYSSQIRNQAIRKNLVDELVPPGTSARREARRFATLVRSHRRTPLARPSHSHLAPPPIVSDDDGGRSGGGEGGGSESEGREGGEGSSSVANPEAGMAAVANPEAGRAVVANLVARRAAAVWRAPMAATVMAGKGECSGHHFRIVVASDSLLLPPAPMVAAPPSARAAGRPSSFRLRH
uniref:Uncharacterized protein n=1 Tax=Oryza sativa subsp. japonica TaxID=39947 RepID=Q652A6_ORYSJ|nr:hypothetical protein [Oryza sativa Japonica Group]